MGGLEVSLVTGRMNSSYRSRRKTIEPVVSSPLQIFVSQGLDRDLEDLVLHPKLFEEVTKHTRDFKLFMTRYCGYVSRW